MSGSPEIEEIPATQTGKKKDPHYNYTTNHSTANTGDFHYAVTPIDYL